MRQLGKAQLVRDELVLHLLAGNLGHHEVLDDLAVLGVKRRQAALELFDLAREVPVGRSEDVDLDRVRILRSAEVVPFGGVAVQLEWSAVKWVGQRSSSVGIETAIGPD